MEGMTLFFHLFNAEVPAQKKNKASLGLKDCGSRSREGLDADHRKGWTVAREEREQAGYMQRQGLGEPTGAQCPGWGQTSANHPPTHTYTHTP